MSTLNTVIAMVGFIGAFVFCGFGCKLLGMELDGIYSLKTLAVLARLNIAVGIIAIVSFYCTMLPIAEGEAMGPDPLTNMIGLTVITAMFGGLGWFLAWLVEIPLLRKAGEERVAARS